MHREKDTEPVCTNCINHPKWFLESVDGLKSIQSCDVCLAKNLRAMGLPARVEAPREDPTIVL